MWTVQSPTMPAEDNVELKSPIFPSITTYTSRPPVPMICDRISSGPPLTTDVTCQPSPLTKTGLLELAGISALPRYLTGHNCCYFKCGCCFGRKHGLHNDGTPDVVEIDEGLVSLRPEKAQHRRHKSPRQGPRRRNLERNFRGNQETESATLSSSFSIPLRNCPTGRFQPNCLKRP